MWSTDDDIGKYCAYADEDAFMRAANTYCSTFSYGTYVPAGASYGLKLNDVPDGYGGQQIFWGMSMLARKRTAVW